jgi:hypothetical protein
MNTFCSQNISMQRLTLLPNNDMNNIAKKHTHSAG